MEEYTPLMPTLDSKARPTGIQTAAVDVGGNDSSDHSDLEEPDPAVISEVLKKDPIVSKYSQKDGEKKKAEVKKIGMFEICR